MKRFATYIAVLAAMVFASACTMNELLEPNSPSDFGDDVVTISPRISHFMDCNVSTRSAKEGDEGKVTSMAMALFPIQGGVIQPSVFYQYNADGNMLFVLDRNKEPFVDANFEGQEFVMYIIANMQGSGIPETSGNGEGIGWTPAEFVEKAHTIDAGSCFEQIGDNGLPMLGSLGDYLSVDAEGNKLADGKHFIFMPEEGTGNEKGLPTVDGTPTDNLEIPMRTLYAKISFTIEVDSDQEIVGNAAPRFDLKGYQVNNAAGTVYLTRVLNVDDENTEYEDVVSSEFHNVEMDGLYAQGAKKATFHCYVPERYLTPATLPSAYTYDFGENGSAITGYENIPAELKKYAQRFKPMLVSDAQKATHVAINGTFTDHQKHVYDVTYKIFLGSDNYGNFDIIRNTHYNNVITIRGINNSDDQPADYDPSDSGDDAPISIDHRVTIDRTTPLVVGLRRETLLDAHFEVRPLRLHLSGGDRTTNPTSATVTLKKAKDSDPALSTWIGMELSGTSDEYITEPETPSSYGKRKYFTTDLISSISDNTSLTVEGLNYNANQTIWLYVDENVNTESRSAILSIAYNYKDPITNEIAAPEDYIITQHGLHKVTYNGNTYYMERFEEYLYNYDVDDRFGQTDQTGMPWGLEGKQLSNKHVAADPSKANLNNYGYVTDAGKTQMNSWVNSYYDFYVKGSRYDDAINTPDPNNDKHTRMGLHFCKEIVGTAEIGELSLNENPQSAVEYCHNKNKRNASGIVEDVVWYLPAVDEIEDVIVGAYNEYHEFQQYDYWSCQPSYHRCYFFMSWQNRTYTQNAQVAGNFDFYIDDTGRARATQAEFTGEIDANGNPVLTYMRSGVEIPESTIEKKTWIVQEWSWSEWGYIDVEKSADFTVQRGYYTWKNKRGDNAADGGRDANGNWIKDYDYINWYVSNTTVDKTIYPEFVKDDSNNPYLQPGNKNRSENARVRCLRVNPN